MTFSIIARDPGTGVLGIAIASRFFAVGAICPVVFSGLGAFSTQASGHPPFAERARELLGAGQRAQAVIDALLADDERREQRQLHIVDAAGQVAAFTGTGCTGWAGSRTADDVSLAGNMLAGAAVLDEALEAFVSTPGTPLAERLLLALEAGQAAGGDSRGQQAAALLIHGRQNFPMVSLRVDDSSAAIAELRRLHRAAAADYYPYMRGLFSQPEYQAVLGR